MISEAFHLKNGGELRISIFEKQKLWMGIMTGQPTPSKPRTPRMELRGLIAGRKLRETNGSPSALIRFMSQTKTPNAGLKGEKLYLQKKAGDWILSNLGQPLGIYEGLIYSSRVDTVQKVSKSLKWNSFFHLDF